MSKLSKSDADKGLIPKKRNKPDCADQPHPKQTQGPGKRDGEVGESGYSVNQQP